MKDIPFYKMQGLGNDFVIINELTEDFFLDKKSITHLAHRHLGIGFDQLLFIKKSTKADFACQIFNADGSEAKQCGNGLRCVARFIHDQGITPQNTFSIETNAGIFQVKIQNNHLVQVTMGIPCFEPANIPMIPEKLTLLSNKIQSRVKQLDILSLGNPHTILQVASLKDFPVKELGTQIGNDAAFPHGINVGFMQVINPAHIMLRTFERGSGETYACGSNACAAAVAGIKSHLLSHVVQVELPFGRLEIEWPGVNEPVMMTGPAEYVFKGSFSTVR